MTNLEKLIIPQIRSYERPDSIALSLRFPRLKKPLILTKITLNKIKNRLFYNLSKTIHWYYFPYVIKRHQSTLFKKLGGSDPKLQRQKVTNLLQAAKKLNGLIIKPGETFSFWETVGTPTAKKGFVNGMLLSNGKVIEGLGGGLCQMSNLLYWLFLHSDMKIIERHHHSMDVFPDSGRTLPFGSGATIMYNFIDLKVQNNTDKPLQLKIWITDKHLKGQILSKTIIKNKYHVHEKNHCFIKRNQKYFRFNEIYRTLSIDGKTIKNEKITENFAPVLYDIDDEYIMENNYSKYNFDFCDQGVEHQLLLTLT